MKTCVVNSNQNQIVFWFIVYTGLRGFFSFFFFFGGSKWEKLNGVKTLVKYITKQIRNGLSSCSCFCLSFRFSLSSNQRQITKNAVGGMLFTWKLIRTHSRYSEELPVISAGRRVIWICFAKENLPKRKTLIFMFLPFGTLCA